MSNSDADLPDPLLRYPYYVKALAFYDAVTSHLTLLQLKRSCPRPKFWVECCCGQTPPGGSEHGQLQDVW